MTQVRCTDKRHRLPMNSPTPPSRALPCGTNQLAPEKLGHQRPNQIGEIGLIAVRLRGREAMIAEMKVVPFQRLAVRVKTFHHSLLHRKGAVLIMATVEDHGRAFDLPRRVAGVTW